MSDLTSPQPAPTVGREDVTEGILLIISSMIQNAGPLGYVISVLERLSVDLKTRREHGITVYGGPLRTFNGRDAAIDAYQEALDCIVYSHQMFQEMVVGERFKDALFWEERASIAVAQAGAIVDWIIKRDAKKKGA